jgi:hypothetical protein
MRRIINWKRSGERRVPQEHEAYFNTDGSHIYIADGRLGPDELRDIAEPVYEEGDDLEGRVASLERGIRAHNDRITTLERAAGGGKETTMHTNVLNGDTQNVNACNCHDTAPTMPVYRDKHLPTCPLYSPPTPPAKPPTCPRCGRPHSDKPRGSWDPCEKCEREMEEPPVIGQAAKPEPGVTKYHADTDVDALAHSHPPASASPTPPAPGVTRREIARIIAQSVNLADTTIPDQILALLQPAIRAAVATEIEKWAGVVEDNKDWTRSVPQMHREATRLRGGKA